MNLDLGINVDEALAILSATGPGSRIWEMIRMNEPETAALKDAMLIIY